MRIERWVGELIPEEIRRDVTVSAQEIVCGDPDCPLDTAIAMLFPRYAGSDSLISCSLSSLGPPFTPTTSSSISLPLLDAATGVLFSLTSLLGDESNLLGSTMKRRERHAENSVGIQKYFKARHLR